MKNANETIRINWNGQETFVFVTCANQSNIFKTTAYADENMMLRVWDERINSIFDSQEGLEKRVKQLRKKAV